MIHPSFFQAWSKDLDRMNRGKQGAAFEYPDALFQYLALVRTRAKGLDYRSLEGFTRGLIQGVKPALREAGMTEAELVRIKAPHFTQIRRRIVKLRLDPKLVSLLEKDEDVCLLLDATGVKVTNRSEWVRKHANHRQSHGWLKVHLAAESKHQQSVTVVVTRERVGDVRKGPELVHRGADAVRRRGARATRAYADGAYDARKVHNACREEGVRPVIRIHRGASRKSKGSPERAKRVREYQKLGYRRWAERLQYGVRWRVEAKIGAVKRTTGEFVNSTSWRGMEKEAQLKFWTHDALLQHDHTGRAPWDDP